MSFSNPLFSLAGKLAVTLIQSPNYLAGSQGWQLRKDGTAEFNSLGGTFQITANGIFFYVPNAGVGNLRMSLTNADGTDPYGNSYHAGLFLNQRQAWLTGDQSDTIFINPNSAVGPEILFAESGFNFASHLQQRSNILYAEEANASGARFEMNMPFSATAGYQGQGSSPASQPPFNVTGSMVLYASGVWAPLSIKCPPSETIAIDQNLAGFNNNSTTSTLSLACQVKQGSTVLQSPNQYGNGAVITPEGAAAGATSMHQKFRRIVVGQDVLGGFAGQTLTITPAWQISSGSALTASVDNTSHISAYPLVYTQFQSG